jgi:hypothetical protein
VNPSRCDEYAKLELKHIQLELLHNRYQHLRHFVDQYYCYRNRIVKRTGRANWEGVVWKDYVSVAARRAHPNRKRVVKEHLVPLKVIETKLRELVAEEKTALEHIASVLEKLTHFGTITKEEDAELRAAGLSRKMPDGFFKEGHPYYNDVLARYKEVGIVLEPKTPNNGFNSDAGKAGAG